jgi:hypothetical protein
MQKLDAHSEPVLHAAPLPFCGTQTPPAQYAPIEQVSVQVFAPPEHASPTHVASAGHGTCWAAGHDPAPSQNEGSVATPFVQAPA